MIFADLKNKYPNVLIVKILVIPQMHGISYRLSDNFFNNHRDFMKVLGIHEIPYVRTPSMRVMMMDWHYIKAMIVDLIAS